MRIIRIQYLISNGEFFRSQIYNEILSSIRHGISLVTHPIGNNNFTINPIEKGNGVKPIKTNCMQYLGSIGWELEAPSSIASRIKPGPIDAVRHLDNNKKFAFEWETGNISSSHRALGKLAIGLITRQLVGGILVLPSRNLYKYLTDRTGNYAEIEPYFPIYQNLTIQEGVLGIIEIEHDATSSTVPLIPKGTDGRALR